MSSQRAPDPPQDNFASYMIALIVMVAFALAILSTLK